MQADLVASTLQALHRTHTELACRRRHLHRRLHENNTRRTIHFQPSEEPWVLPLSILQAPRPLTVRLLRQLLPPTFAFAVLLLPLLLAIWPQQLRPRLHLLLPSPC